MTSKMTSIFSKRVAFITVLFGAFGGALTLLLKIEEMKTYYPALGMLVALLVSLLVSLLIQGKRNPKVRMQFKIAAAILFILFLTCAVMHTRLIINHTFEYHEFDVTSRYVKGVYSDSGDAVKRKYPMLNDEQVLYQKMDGVDGIRIYWTPASIDNNIFLLIISYCGVVLFFTASITFYAEVLAEKKEGRRKPNRSNGKKGAGQQEGNGG